MEALVLLKKLLRDEHLDVATSLNNVGYTFGELGKHEEALKYLKKAFAMLQTLCHPDHPTLKVFSKNIEDIKEKANIMVKKLVSDANCFQNQGNNESALEFYTKALVLLIEIYDEKSSGLSKSFFSLEIVRHILLSELYLMSKIIYKL